MKTLNIIFAISFTVFASTIIAQDKFVADGSAANNVTMSAVKFEKNANGAAINWQASNESNTSQFELQISYDNKSFETIKTVAASDITKWATNYQVKFNKTYITIEKVYYRIKTVFTNGDENITATSIFETLTGNEISYVSIH